MTLQVAQTLFSTLRGQGWLIETDERRTGVRGRVLVRATRGERVLMCDAPNLGEAAECLRRLVDASASGPGESATDAA